MDKTIKVGSVLDIYGPGRVIVVGIRIDENGRPLIDLALEDGAQWLCRFEEIIRVYRY